MGLIKIIQKVVDKLKQYGKLVMFSHTIFSLSFAVVAMVLASKGIPDFKTVFFILVCFMGARTGANAINRVIDAEIDARNPRTKSRQLPKGEINKKEVILLTSFCFLVMLYGAYRLNFICLLLSPIALILLIGYSYCKRFTFLCHFVLGVTCACAPVGAWLAVTGSLTWVPLFLGAANTLWVAGFDIIYGCQDYEFDKANNLHSVPVKFGVKYALWISAFLHTVTLFCLIAIGILSPDLSVIYYTGIAVIAALFLAEYRMVSPDNLVNVNIASYSVNQIVSIVFLLFGLTDAFL
ncbi:UbiA-like polyprenyltransferase [Anaerocolumna sp. AGMB13020]|uniref:UbiA-like polyprenyltransferase n=1 Tax=Anaerocolumna sp. AGMB13020 TaxID=3081750 RepID=UPI0029537C0C|nr:UbiA-like polyprenyltransferase [Anaerocolumna sp. AGMB13020]WOO36133.1 UbiA-like polyprenyltransferase [Anaerocolumna sp. AGMB13020]